MLQSLAAALQQAGWKKTGCDDIVTRFEYSSGKEPIAAAPTGSEGCGWIARVEGNCEVSISKVMRVSCCTCSICNNTDCILTMPTIN